MSGESGDAFSHYVRNAGERFHVVDYRGALPQTLDCRERRTGTGHSALTFDGIEKRGFFAADERARAETDMYAERKARAENVVADKAERFRLFDCYFKSVDRYGIFRSYVEVAVLRADRVARDHHTFDYGKGVAFENGSVHERAGIALVAVTDDVLLAVRLSVSELPLSAGGESATAAASESGIENIFDHVRPVHFKSVFKTFERARAESLVYIFGIDASATVQSDTNLLFIESDFVLLGDLRFRGGIDV